MQDETSGLVRELGLAEALAIGLGTMIGAGIFVLSAEAARRAGPGAALSYLLAGLICLPIAMTISELATGMPQAGGSYNMISRSLGAGAGTVVGLGNWLGLVFATAFYLIGFAQYVSRFVPIPIWVTVLVSGLLFIWLNYRGAKVSGAVQKVIVLFLVLLLAFFVGKGLFHLDPDLHRPFLPYGWGKVVANVGLIIVSFTGFEKISTLAEEVRRPGRTLPLAIVGSVLVATLLYGMVLYVSTGVLSYEVMAEYAAPLVEVADRFMSTVGVIGVSLAALLATAAATNAAIMASSRINFAMGRDHVLPDWFNQVHPRYLTPHRSVAVTGGLVVLLALSGQTEVLAEVSSALFMVSYALLTVGLLVMRRARPSWYRPAFRVPLFPWLSLLGGAAALGVIATMDPISQIAGLGLAGVGLVWHLAWGRRQAPVEGELAVWMARERPIEGLLASVTQVAEGRRNEILVPVANPATAKPLVTLAAQLVRGEENARVAALKIVTTPLNLPLSVAEETLLAGGPSQDDLLRRAAKHGVAAGARMEILLRAAHGVASGIMAVARSRPRTRLVLLGWHGPLVLSRIRSSVDKEVVRKAPCDVAVLLNRGLEKVRRVLVPAGGGPHARLGLRLAWNLIEEEAGAELVVLRVLLPPGEVDLAAEQAALEHLIRGELAEVDGRVRGKVVRAASVVGGILGEAQEGYDLLIIGASEEWSLRNWLFGAIPDVVAERASCSVLLVKKHEPSALSWFRRFRRQRR